MHLLCTPASMLLHYPMVKTTPRFTLVIKKFQMTKDVSKCLCVSDKLVMSEFVVGSKGIEGPCRPFKTRNICRQLVSFSCFWQNCHLILLHFSNYASLDLDDIRRRRKDNLPTHVSNFLKRRNKRDVSWHNPCEEHYHLNPKCYTVLQKASFNCHNNSKFQGSEFYRK